MCASCWAFNVMGGGCRWPAKSPRPRRIDSHLIICNLCSRCIILDQVHTVVYTHRHRGVWRYTSILYQIIWWLHFGSGQGYYMKRNSSNIFRDQPNYLYLLVQWPAGETMRGWGTRRVTGGWICANHSSSQKVMHHWGGFG